MIEKWEWLSFKVGQWKVEYSRERRISSGEQQMVDRSIINRPFTVDRQQGVEVYGRLKGKGVADFNYWAAALTGTGRGNVNNDDNHLMYFGDFNGISSDDTWILKDLIWRNMKCLPVSSPLSAVTNQKSIHTLFTSRRRVFGRL